MILGLNKLFRKLLEISYPVISNQKFWRILSEFEKPLKPHLSDGNLITSTNIIGIVRIVNNKDVKSQSSSSFFAETLNIPKTKNFSPIQKRV